MRVAMIRVGQAIVFGALAFLAITASAAEATDEQFAVERQISSVPDASAEFAFNRVQNIIVGPDLVPVAELESDIEVLARTANTLSIFEQVFVDRQQASYTPFWCPTNVHRLLQKLSDGGIDLSKATVLYLLPSFPVVGFGEDVIHPKHPRVTDGSVANDWTFHVVVEVDGHIFDLDYTNNALAPLTADYFSTMWGVGTEETAMFVRRVPAADYLRDYQGNWQSYVTGGEGRYPSAPLDAALTR